MCEHDRFTRPDDRSFDRRLMDDLPDPVFVIDRRRRVVFGNQAARAMFSDGAEGRDLALVIRHPAALDSVAEVLAGGAARRTEITLSTPVTRVLDVHARPLAAAGDTASPAVLLVLRDITAIKATERMRAEFVANVSHELRSPLTSLVGLTETLRGAAGADAEARARFLVIMEREANRMARLVDDLLALSRVEAAAHLLPHGRVPITALLERVSESLAVRARDRDMEIVLDCAPDVGAATGDEDELARVFHNLLDNAISYADEGTAITVIARRVPRIPVAGGAGIAVAVEDRGQGVAAEHIPRLTERFYRIDEGRSRAMGGTGLGLAIVKHIVNRHRGHLAVESELGKGSTFTVYLPAADEAACVIKPS